MPETESAAAVAVRLNEHRARTNVQKVQVIPAADATVIAAKASYESALLGADAAELFALKSALAAAQDVASTERTRLAVMEKHTDTLVADEKAARIREQIPAYESACRQYVDACRTFHAGLAALPTAVASAAAAIAVINHVRNIGLDLPFEISDIQPSHNTPHRSQPVEFSRILMAPAAAADILRVAA